MCGLFGAVGKQIDAASVRALAIVNRDRGKDSLGVFDSSGKLVKQAGDPADVLATSDMSQFIAHPDRWFLAGHTRSATRGVVKRRNSHPFRYGNILGSHNGMCHAPKEFAVDSMYLFHRLNKCRGDYQKALENVSGYWSLTWFDGDGFYVQTHDNTLWFTKINETFYYSSTKAHLRAAMGDVDCWPVNDGETYRFNPDGSVVQLPSIVVKAEEYWWKGGQDADRWFPVTRKTETGTITTYKQGRAFRDGELESTPFADDKDERSAWHSRELYEDASRQMGYASIADLMNTEQFDNRYDAYDYVDQFYGDVSKII